MAILIDGAALAAKCKAQIREEAAALSRAPLLAVVLAGNDPASQIYVRGKERDCAASRRTSPRGSCWPWWTG